MLQRSLIPIGSYPGPRSRTTNTFLSGFIGSGNPSRLTTVSRNRLVTVARFTFNENILNADAWPINNDFTQTSLTSSINLIGFSKIAGPKEVNYSACFIPWFAKNMAIPCSPSCYLCTPTFPLPGSVFTMLVKLKHICGKKCPKCHQEKMPEIVTVAIGVDHVQIRVKPHIGWNWTPLQHPVPKQACGT